MYMIRVARWLKDYQGYRPDFLEFTGETLKETVACWKSARDNNDITKYEPLYIYDILNTEEE